MLARAFPRLSRPNVRCSTVASAIIYRRETHSGSTIADPPPPSAEAPTGNTALAESSSLSTSSALFSSTDIPPLVGDTTKPGLPATSSPDLTSRSLTYYSPPFHTHAFFKALERTFPEETARSLMRATRALLVDRIGRVRNEALTVKDLDNVPVLYFLILCSLLYSYGLIASLSFPSCLI